MRFPCRKEKKKKKGRKKEYELADSYFLLCLQILATVMSHQTSEELLFLIFLILHSRFGKVGLVQASTKISNTLDQE